jgi:lysophospholipase L1-like esterase
VNYIRHHLRYLAASLLVGCSEKGSTVLLGDSIFAAVKSDAVNFAQSGATLAQIRKQALNVTESVGLVIVEGGINDMGNGRGAQIPADYAAILTTIPSNVAVRVVGVLPVEEGSLAPGWRVATNEKISQVNRAVFAVCRARPNCSFHQVAPFETIDGIHPTTSGLEQLRKEIIP